MVAAFEKASGRSIPYRIVEPSPGDTADLLCRSNESKTGTWMGSRKRN